MIEIIIALGVFSLLASALTTLVFSSSAGFWVGDTEAQAAALLRQSVEEIKQIKAGAWNEIVVGTTTIALPQSELVNMTKTVTVSDVCRSAGVIVACPSGSVDAFSKQVTVSIAFETRTGRTRQMSSDVILTNWDSVDWDQTSWVGGSGATMLSVAAPALPMSISYRRKRSKFWSNCAEIQICRKSARTSCERIWPR